MLSHLFVGGRRASSLPEGLLEANATGTVDLTDAVYLLNFLFTGGAPLAAPFFECGSDPTPDGLSCDSFPAC